MVRWRVIKDACVRRVVLVRSFAGYAVCYLDAHLHCFDPLNHLPSPSVIIITHVCRSITFMTYPSHLPHPRPPALATPDPPAPLVHRCTQTTTTAPRTAGVRHTNAAALPLTLPTPGTGRVRYIAALFSLEIYCMTSFFYSILYTSRPKNKTKRSKKPLIHCPLPDFCIARD